MPESLGNCLKRIGEALSAEHTEKRGKMKNRGKKEKKRSIQRDVVGKKDSEIDEAPVDSLDSLALQLFVEFEWVVRSTHTFCQVSIIPQITPHPNPEPGKNKPQ